MKATLNLSALKNYDATRLDRPDLEMSAVLVPLIHDEYTDRIVFTVRHDRLRFQPGEISFPGGKVDPGDSDLASCAIREAKEELGLPPDRVEVIAELDQITVSSRYVLSPFVGLVNPAITL
ncbi:MAG: NUDIX hydrolase, partial [Gemmatimonadaceae bacterium]